MKVIATATIAQMALAITVDKHDPNMVMGPNGPTDTAAGAGGPNGPTDATGGDPNYDPNMGGDMTTDAAGADPNYDPATMGGDMAGEYTDDYPTDATMDADYVDDGYPCDDLHYQCHDFHLAWDDWHMAWEECDNEFHNCQDGGTTDPQICDDDHTACLDAAAAIEPDHAHDPCHEAAVCDEQFWHEMEETHDEAWVEENHDHCHHECKKCDACFDAIDWDAIDWENFDWETQPDPAAHCHEPDVCGECDACWMSGADATQVVLKQAEEPTEAEGAENEAYYGYGEEDQAYYGYVEEDFVDPCPDESAASMSCWDAEHKAHCDQQFENCQQDNEPEICDDEHDMCLGVHDEDEAAAYPAFLMRRHGNDTAAGDQGHHHHPCAHEDHQLEKCWDRHYCETCAEDDQHCHEWCANHDDGAHNDPAENLEEDHEGHHCPCHHKCKDAHVMFQDWEVCAFPEDWTHEEEGEAAPALVSRDDGAEDYPVEDADPCAAYWPQQMNAFDDCFEQSEFMDWEGCYPKLPEEVKKCERCHEKMWEAEHEHHEHPDDTAAPALMQKRIKQHLGQ